MDIQPTEKSLITVSNNKVIYQSSKTEYRHLFYYSNKRKNENKI